MPVLRAQTCKCQLERTEAEDTGQWRVEHHKLFFWKIFVLKIDNSIVLRWQKDIITL